MVLFHFHAGQLEFHSGLIQFHTEQLEAIEDRSSIIQDICNFAGHFEFLFFLSWVLYLAARLPRQAHQVAHSLMEKQSSVIDTGCSSD